MKNSYLFLFVSILCIKCTLLLTGDEEVFYTYKNSICLIDSDGKNLQTLKKDAWGDLFYFLNDDEIFFVGNDTMQPGGPVYIDNLVYLNGRLSMI